MRFAAWLFKSGSFWSDTRRSEVLYSLLLLRDPWYHTVWWAGSMDPQQSALLLLHGNSFAVSSGQVPKLSAGYDEGGGEGKETELNQPNMTSSAHVSSRLNPGEHLQCPLEPLGHCHAEVDFKSRSCGLLAICHSGVIYPWMNPRPADSELYGNSGFVFFFKAQKWVHNL